MRWALVDRSANRVGAGPTVDSAATKSILVGLPADSHAEFLQMLQEACADGLPRRLTITHSNSPMQVLDIVPLKLEQVDDRPALVILYDSNEFDKSKDRLSKAARRNEAILRCSMDGFFVVDSDCRFLEVNEAFCRMTGYSADELMRMRITDLEVSDHAAGGVPSHTQTGLHHFPTAHLHKHGHIVHLEISVNVLHDNGEKILVGFARDVTERMHSEQELARLTRQQRLILDSAGEGIAGFDRDGKITFINPAAATMFNSRDRQLIGCSAHEVLLHSKATPQDCNVASCPICSVLKTGRRAAHMSAEFARADGTHFPVEYSITAMHAGHEIIGAVLTFCDVTERRAAERERQELQAQIEASRRMESLGMLAGGIAHDLNNMLAGIQGNAGLALSDLPADSPIGTRIGRIVSVCERASKVVDQILTAAGRKTRDMVLLDLNELAHDTVELMRATIPERIRLELRLSKMPPIIEGDSGQLQQVITNLLVNAIEAMEDGAGRITVTTDMRQIESGEIAHAFPGHELTPGQYACVTVADTGCGMAAETRPRIFEPFFSTKGHGRGLGLSALHGVVGSHRGGVQVESTVGAGTSFTVVFPAGQVAALEEPSPKVEQQRHSDEATVLVIDDDDDVRSVIHDVLAASGFSVLTAENGTRGIEVFKQNSDVIDVVLLDTIMPGLSGREVYHELVELRPNVKVIVISGYTEELSLSRFGDRKPLAFVHKPFMNADLVEKISEALGD